MAAATKAAHSRTSVLEEPRCGIRGALAARRARGPTHVSGLSDIKIGAFCCTPLTVTSHSFSASYELLISFRRSAWWKHRCCSVLSHMLSSHPFGSRPQEAPLVVACSALSAGLPIEGLPCSDPSFVASAGDRSLHPASTRQLNSGTIFAPHVDVGV